MRKLRLRETLTQQSITKKKLRIRETLTKQFITGEN